MDHPKSLSRRVIVACGQFAVGAVLACYPIQQARAHSLERMEEIAGRARSLDQFLSNPALIEEYYQAFAQYEGGEAAVPRASFNAILEQLRVLTKKNPILSRRLWAKSSNQSPSIRIESTVSDHPIEMQAQRWENVREEWLATLKKDASPLMSIEDKQERQQKIESVIAAIRSRIVKFQEHSESLSKKAKASQSGAFFRDLKSDPEFRSVLALKVLEKVSQPDVSQRLHSTEGANILHELSQLRRDSKNLIPSSQAQDESIGRFAEELIPLPETLAKDSVLFPNLKNGELPEKLSRAQLIEFKPVPRPLHGLWKGIASSECIGGSCARIESLVPERWVTAGIKNSRLFYVETNGHYNGYIHEVPVKLKDKTYASLDLMSPVLTKEILLENGNSRSVFDAWYSQEYPEIKKRWSGAIIGNSGAVDNESVRPALHSSDYYIQGTDLGRRSVTIDDPILKWSTVGRIEPKMFATYYVAEKKKNRRLIVETTVPQNERIVLLADPQHTKSHILEDVQFIEDSFNGRHGLDQEIRIFTALADTNPRNPQIKSLVQSEVIQIRRALSDKGSAVGKLATRLFTEGNAETTYAYLKFQYQKPKTPQEYIEMVRIRKSWFNETTGFIWSGYARFIHDSWADFFALNPSLAEIKQLHSELGSLSLYHQRAFFRRAAPHMKTAEDFFAFFYVPQQALEKPDFASREMLAGMVREFLPRLLELKPSAFQMNQFINKVTLGTNTQLESELVEASIPLAKSASELGRLLRFHIGIAASAPYIQRVKQRVEANLKRFTSMNPTVDDFISLGENLNSIGDLKLLQMRVQEEALKTALTHQDIVKIWKSAPKTALARARKVPQDLFLSRYGEDASAFKHLIQEMGADLSDKELKVVLERAISPLTHPGEILDLLQVSTEAMKLNPGKELHLRSIDGVIRSSLTKFAGLNPTAEEFLRLKDYSFTIGTDLAIVEKALSQAATIKDILKLTIVRIINPRQSYLDGMNALKRKYLPALKQLNPTEEQLALYGASLAQAVPAPVAVPNRPDCLAKFLRLLKK